MQKLAAATKAEQEKAAKLEAEKKAIERKAEEDKKALTEQKQSMEEENAKLKAKAAFLDSIAGVSCVCSLRRIERFRLIRQVEAEVRGGRRGFGQAERSARPVRGRQTEAARTERVEERRRERNGERGRGGAAGVPQLPVRCGPAHLRKHAAPFAVRHVQTGKALP